MTTLKNIIPLIGIQNMQTYGPGNSKLTRIHRLLEPPHHQDPCWLAKYTLLCSLGAAETLHGNDIRNSSIKNFKYYALVAILDQNQPQSKHLKRWCGVDFYVLTHTVHNIFEELGVTRRSSIPPRQHNVLQLAQQMPHIPVQHNSKIKKL